LAHALTAARSYTKHKISHVYLHVQTSNVEAKKFYGRHGFRETGIQEDYYKKILPHDAWILEKAFTTETTEERKNRAPELMGW
jgi:ribosomal protein S18 acetylase RimI-like enzyme